MSALKNLPASVKARLETLAGKRGEEFNLLLTRYGIERLLYRLSQSQHADKFLLKGAMLFAIWDIKTHRPTQDLIFWVSALPKKRNWPGFSGKFCKRLCRPTDWSSIRILSGPKKSGRTTPTVASVFGS